MTKLPDLFSRGLLVSLTVMLFDQLVKWMCVALVQQAGGRIEVAPFFNLVMVWNKGVSFGMLAGHDAWLALVIFTFGMLVFLSLWLWRNAEPLVALALGLAIGGASGNLIDRFHYGAVADFFDFHLYGNHWPAFNIADSAIVLGVIIIAGHSLLGAPGSRKEDNAHEK